MQWMYKTRDASLLSARGKSWVCGACGYCRSACEKWSCTSVDHQTSTCRKDGLDWVQVIMCFILCFSAWNSGCGRNRRVPHAVSTCPWWSPCTGPRPAPPSHDPPGLAMPACSCDPKTSNTPPVLSLPAWTPHARLSPVHGGAWTLDELTERNCDLVVSHDVCFSSIHVYCVTYCSFKRSFVFLCVFCYRRKNNISLSHFSDPICKPDEQKIIWHMLW